MKYFSYISAAKIDMLYAQIAPAHDKEFSIGMDVKVLKADAKTKVSATDNIYRKLSLVVDKLKELDLVGDLNSKKPYILDVMHMRVGGFGWGTSEEPSPIVFWGGPQIESGFTADCGENPGTLLAMAGSRHHVIGENAPDGAHSHSLTDAMTLWFLQNLDEELPVSATRDDNTYPRLRNYRGLTDKDVAHGAYLAATQMDGRVQKVEFLAKVLHRSKWHEGFSVPRVERVILGSPLYVCEAE